jgi:protein-S-isoprenylcysteine O-methyltransferase Ste14
LPASKRPTPRKLAVYAIAAAIVYFARPSPSRVAFGGILVSAGIALRIWACGHLEKNKLVVTTGPYAFVKNPLSLGSCLVAAGLGLAAASPAGRGKWVLFGALPLILLAFFLVYFPRKKRVEGTRMREKFGEAWERYDASVPDFVPRLLPWRSGDPRRFSWRLVLANHEPPMDLLIVALFAAIALREEFDPLLSRAG